MAPQTICNPLEGGITSILKKKGNLPREPCFHPRMEYGRTLALEQLGELRPYLAPALKPHFPAVLLRAATTGLAENGNLHGDRGHADSSPNGPGGIRRICDPATSIRLSICNWIPNRWHVLDAR